MCEYTIRITGKYDVLILSPETIAALIEKVRRSDTMELVIPAQELLARGYTDYLADVMRANRQGGWPDVQRRDVYLATAGQIKMLRINRRQCFDTAEIVTQQNHPAFHLDTNREFFFLARQNGSIFRYVYKNVEGEEIKLRFV